MQSAVTQRREWARRCIALFSFRPADLDDCVGLLAKFEIEFQICREITKNFEKFEMFIKIIWIDRASALLAFVSQSTGC
jgi:hypothetical protein